MADVYYEIADWVIPKFGGRYFVSHGVENAYVPRWRASYLQHSDRAWMEQEGKVWFIKHRYETSPTVDMKEFMWIKLSAEDARG